MKEFEKGIELPCNNNWFSNKFQSFKGEWTLLETKICDWCGFLIVIKMKLMIF